MEKWKILFILEEIYKGLTIFIARKVGDNWMDPYAVYKDNWQIAGCPVNGPMLAINKSNIALAWYTAANESAQIKVAFS